MERMRTCPSAQRDSLMPRDSVWKRTVRSEPRCRCGEEVVVVERVVWNAVAAEYVAWILDLLGEDDDDDDLVVVVCCC